MRAVSIALLLLAAAGSAPLCAQIPEGSVTVTASPAAPVKKGAPSAALYPYAFTNFVWWSDAELRTELHHRLPALGDTIATDSPQVHEIHDALVAMLKKKHIHADVQSIAPSVFVTLGEDAPRARHAPPLAIQFSVVSPPAINVGVTHATGSPAELAPQLEDLVSRRSGKAYSRAWFWTVEAEAVSALSGKGYLAATAELTSGTPAKDGEAWTVPLTLAVIPGPQFHVSTVKLDAGPLLEGHNITRFIAIHPGDLASDSGFNRLEMAVRQYYWSKGYADVRFHAEPELDREHALAAYNFTTDPGPEYHVHAVNIEDLSPAQSGEVRSALALKPGDVFDLSKLQGLSRLLKDSPTLIARTFDYSYLKNKRDATVDITLHFHAQ